MMPSGVRPSTGAETARRHSEKGQLQEIRERFGSYIQCVRSMRSQLTQGQSSALIQSLQEEMAAMRGLYERELGELREKLTYQEGSRDHQSAMMAGEYQSRLSEMSGELLRRDEQIGALQLALAQQESSVQSLKGAAVTPTIQRDLARQELRELQGNLQMAQAKYEEEFSQRLAFQERAQELTIYIEDLKQVHAQEVQDLRGRIVQSEGLVLELEERMRSMSRGGPAVMETVQRMQEASEAEARRLQEETESNYNHNLLELQMRLNADQIRLAHAQEESELLHQRVEQLTTEMAALEKKLQSEEAGSRTLMERMECERARSGHQARALEARLEELQDLLLTKMKELSSFQETNISLRGELDALKSMLEEEEQLMVSSNLLPHTCSSSSDPLTRSFPSPVTYLIPDFTRKTEAPPPVTSCDPAGHSAPTSCDPAGHSAPTSCDPAGHSAPTSPEESSLNEEEHVRKSSQELPEVQTEIKRSQSAPPLSTQIPDLGDSPGSSASMMDSVSPRHTSRTPPLTSRDRKAVVSSAVGDLEISEVDPSGNFIKIINRSLDKEKAIGGFLLQQNVRGHPVSVYRFPPTARVMASCAVTVWASSSGVAHNPPIDLLCKEPSKFVSEQRCTTILCTPNGQALAWFTPLRDNVRTSQEKYIPEPKPKSPVHTPEQPKEEPIPGRNLHSPPLPAPQIVKKVSMLLKREKMPPAGLPPATSPWTQSPASPTHPDFTLSRLEPLGSDGNSLCRQARSQTATTDRHTGVPGDGFRPGGESAVSSASRKSRGPTRSAGVGKGTLRLLLPGSYAPPSAQHRVGLQILQSVQNLQFQPPMPRPAVFLTSSF